MSQHRLPSEEGDNQHVRTNQESLRNQGAISFGRTLLSGQASVPQSPQSPIESNQIKNIYVPSSGGSRQRDSGALENYLNENVQYQLLVEQQSLDSPEKFNFPVPSNVSSSSK